MTAATGEEFILVTVYFRLLRSIGDHAGALFAAEHKTHSELYRPLLPFFHVKILLNLSSFSNLAVTVGKGCEYSVFGKFYSGSGKIVVFS